MSLNEAQWVWMSLIESEWVWLSLNESEWVWMSLNESQIRHKRLIKSSSINLLHDRSRKYWREHSQKSHTNEKSHANQRIWSESHFRLFFFFFFKKYTQKNYFDRNTLCIIWILNNFASFQNFVLLKNKSRHHSEEKSEIHSQYFVKSHLLLLGR